MISDGVFIVPNTSKTEVETRNVLKSLGIKTSFVIENGAKLCDIQQSFQFIDETDKEFGIEVSELNIRLERLSGRFFANDFQPINELKRENASQILGLTGPKLEEALERQYSLLYRYVGPKSKIPFWHEALLKVGLNLSCKEHGKPGYA